MKYNYEIATDTRTPWANGLDTPSPQPAGTEAVSTVECEALNKTVVLCLALAGVIAMLLLTLTTLTNPPAEDAVILHQYSRNLAETVVISYVPGGSPAEGATDFLWMLYISLGIKLHLDPVASTAIANLLCAFGLSSVLFRIAKRNFQWIPAFAILGAFALMPQTWAAAVGFSVLPFALFIATTIMFAHEGLDCETALSALILCLLRPDGVVFAGPVIALRLATVPKSRALMRYLLIFILPGCIYFVWRWKYFQHFLPLPFLVKSDTQRIYGIFAPTAHTLVRYLVFGGAVIIGALGKNILKKHNLRFLLMTLIVPAFFYSAMRLDQNVFYRFYFFVPLMAAIVVAIHWDKLAWGPNVLLRVALIAFVLCIARVDWLSAQKYRSDCAYWRRNEGIARRMSGIRGTLLTSEAGEFAYYSRWNTYDSWGLNTPEYATHLILPAEIRKLAPDVISILSTECGPVISPMATERTFDSLFRNIKTAVAQSGTYEAWQVPGSLTSTVNPASRLCWYIRKTFSGRSSLEAILADAGGAPLGNEDKRQ